MPKSDKIWCDSAEPAQIKKVQPLFQHFACPWPPTKLAHMLLEQQRAVARAPPCDCCKWWQCPLYNEIVLDAASVLAALPSAVEAFYYPHVPDDPKQDAVIASARAAHRNFLVKYGVDRQRVPLLSVSNLDTSAPFALADE